MTGAAAASRAIGLRSDGASWYHSCKDRIVA
jgi:hypothetical protein